MLRIHVVGISARTGTTLLVEAMRACFEIDGFHEREAPLTARLRGVAIHLSKDPKDIHSLGPRLKLDPRLHVVCMVRDPRDVIVSENWTRPGTYFVASRFPQRGAASMRRFTSHPRFTVIRYEDLVASPSEVQRALEQRMPFLKRTADFGDFHRVASAVSEGNSNDMHGVRPIDTSSIGNWRNHLPQIADQRDGLTALLVDLGYERDSAWEAVLDGAVPVAQSTGQVRPPLEAEPLGAFRDNSSHRMMWLPPAVRRPLRGTWHLGWHFWVRSRHLGRRSWIRAKSVREGLRGMAESLSRSRQG